MLLKLPFNQNQTQFNNDVVYKNLSDIEKAQSSKIKNIILEILLISFLLTTIFYFFISYQKSQEELQTKNEIQIDLKNKSSLTLEEELMVLKQELAEMEILESEFVFPQIDDYFTLE